jgi:alkanesulfonate monooxygenase
VDLAGALRLRGQAILDYIDLGVDIISMRGYDLLQDAVDVGQQVIPLVREEVARRDAALAG